MNVYKNIVERRPRNQLFALERLMNAKELVFEAVATRLALIKPPRDIFVVQTEDAMLEAFNISVIHKKFTNFDYLLEKTIKLLHAKWSCIFSPYDRKTATVVSYPVMSRQKIQLQNVL